MPRTNKPVLQLISITGSLIAIVSGVNASECAEKLNYQSPVEDIINCLRVQEIELNASTIEVPVGTIIASLVPPDKMNQEVWKLADGGMVSAVSRYAAEANLGTKVPDLRGMFLRGLNFGRSDELQDPDGANRSAGDFQHFKTSLPAGDEPFTGSFEGSSGLAGTHSHIWLGGHIPYSGGGGHDVQGYSPRDRRNAEHSGAISSAGDHEHDVMGFVAIDQGGDSETRPNNVSVYYYVKIN